MKHTNKTQKIQSKYSARQIFTVALLTVAGTGALISAGVNAAPILSSPKVTTALQSGDLSALKTALLAQVQDRATKETAKINTMTETDLKNMQTREANRLTETAKTTEYETKLTDILKADSTNKDGFTTTAKEYFTAIKTLHASEVAVNSSTETSRSARPVMADPAGTMLTELYNRSVIAVKAGKTVVLRGGKYSGERFRLGGSRHGRSGTYTPTDTSVSSSSSSNTTIQ